MASDTLTAARIRNAAPGKHFDGKGLFLYVKPNGTRTWRLKYRFGGREKTITFGQLPEVSLAEARGRRDDARKLLRDGRDPSATRQAHGLAVRQNKEAAFAVVADAWLEYKRVSWAPATYKKAKFVVDHYLAPALRRCSITTLATDEAASALEDMATRVPSLAAKARSYLGSIINFAIRRKLRDEGRLLALKGIIKKRKKTHIPAAIESEQPAELTRAIYGYAVPVTRAALKICMLTAQRPGNVASMRWAHLHLDAKEWHIPAELMKMGEAHVVPLSSQAVATLREMEIYSAGREFVFPPLARQKTAHLHRDALSNALRRMGFAGRHATHGFRAMFRTLASENLYVSPDVLEAQLAHVKQGEVTQAYDRAQFVARRHKCMQQWADYLDQLRTGRKGKVVQLRRARHV